MKVFRVSIEMEMYVVADGAYEAEETARYFAREEIINGVDAHAVEINSIKQVSPPWDVESIPYGSKDDKTLGDLLGEVL